MKIIVFFLLVGTFSAHAVPVLLEENIIFECTVLSESSAEEVPKHSAVRLDRLNFDTYLLKMGSIRAELKSSAIQREHTDVETVQLGWSGGSLNLTISGRPLSRNGELVFSKGRERFKFRVTCH